MIVEDESIIALELEHKLKKMGHLVTAVVSKGEAALERVMTDKPDVILMDIRLAGKWDGIETAEKIRSQIDLPIVFLTAYLDKSRMDRAKSALPFAYMLKPIQESDLESTIEMALFSKE